MRATRCWRRSGWREHRIRNASSSSDASAEPSPLDAANSRRALPGSACYNPENRHERMATWSDENPTGRWRRYGYEDLIQRDKTSVDIFWLRNESLEDAANLPEPDLNSRGDHRGPAGRTRATGGDSGRPEFSLEIFSSRWRISNQSSTVTERPKRLGLQAESARRVGTRLFSSALTAFVCTD